MAEAGRTILLRDFIAMLGHEAGAQTGDDIEDVHEMRVATRRMRSALRLLEPYYPGKSAPRFRRALGEVAAVLGDIRDRDVLLDNMAHYLETLPEATQTALRQVMAVIEAEREGERTDLHKLIGKARYARFVKQFSAFLTAPAAPADDTATRSVAPTLVRHVLPTVVYEHLGIVRAYDSVIATADAPTLHQLRIEFKRLRYAIGFFEEVLGSGAKTFLKELKAIQDQLGRMQDIATAHALLDPVAAKLDAPQLEALNAYFLSIDTELAELMGRFPEVWKKFESKTIQKQLTSAIAVL
jgi:CHAD domain-containing protein